MKVSSIFNARKSTSFQILYCVLGRSIKIRNLTKHGRKEWDGLHLLKATETMTESMESRRNSSGTFSQDLIRCSSAKKSKVYCTDWEKHQKTFTGRILFMSMFNDISCGTKDNKQRCLARARLVSLYARKFLKDNGHSLVLVPKRSACYSMKEESTRNLGQIGGKDVD